MESLFIFQRNIKWRFQNPITIIMTLLPPLLWLLLYGSIFANSTPANFTAFVLPGILVLVIFSSSGSSGASNYSGKMEGAFYRIHISPVKRGSIVLGHVLDATVLSFIEIAVLLLAGFAMSVRFTSLLPSIPLMIVLLLVTIFFVASLSYLLSLILPNEDVFHILMNTFVLPVFFMSTALIPYENIPDSLQGIVSINPFTHVINSLRNLILSPAIDWPQYG